MAFMARCLAAACILSAVRGGRAILRSVARHLSRDLICMPSPLLSMTSSLQRRSAAEAATAALDGAKRQADEEAERAAREKSKRQRLEDDNRVGSRLLWCRPAVRADHVTTSCVQTPYEQTPPRSETLTAAVLS
jgi:hypothetical protein